MDKERDYKEHLLQQLLDLKEAAAYLNTALQDEDPHVFLLGHCAILQKPKEG